MNGAGQGAAGTCLECGTPGLQVPPIEPRTPSTQPPDASLRVLVVDDSEPNRRLAEVLVRRHGFDVASVADGSTALRRLEDEPFDLVLLDTMMPGPDGPAVAREVRRREAAAALDPIQIVAFTASVLPEDRARMLEAGMNDHLAKPLRAEDLAAVLGRRLPGGTIPRTARILGPVTGAASEPGAGDPPIVDEEAFGRLVDIGDARLVERVVVVLLEAAALRVAEIDGAILDRDLDHLRGSLDALEGPSALVGASGLSKRIEVIQDEIREREERGGDPFSPPIGPSGLEALLDATRNELVKRL